MKILSIFFICLISVHIGLGYKILSIFTHEGKSHQHFFEPIITELASKGHQVTVVTYHPFKLKPSTLKEIILTDKKKMGVDVFEIDLFTVPRAILAAGSPIVLTRFGIDACHNMFSNGEIQELISSDQTFDLIIAEMFNSDCVYGFVDKFRAPLIGMSSTTIMPWHTDRFGQPDNPAYIPMNHGWHGGQLDFSDRLQNTLYFIWYKAVYYFYNVGASKLIAERYFKKKIDSFSLLIQNTSLLLVNSHFSMEHSKPTVPRIIDVGGAHIPQLNHLPINIEKFINESEHGVIYFSLGSMIKGHTLPHDKRKAFLKVFSRLPQRVLWKWENESMPDKPDNVMIQKWMPQFDILSNPNVKAFISHGGLLGTTEAVHCGVPMVVMPQYGDQHTNAKAIEANGGGVILYLNDVNEDTLYESLQKILDPAFQKKAKELSERFRDRPMSPMDTAIYWVEYVARHKGAPHLRTAAVGMPLYQYLLLDVIGFLIAVLLIFMYITYKILSLTIGVVFRKKVKQS